MERLERYFYWHGKTVARSALTFPVSILRCLPQVPRLLHLLLHLRDADLRPGAAHLQGGGGDDGSLGAQVHHKWLYYTKMHNNYDLLQRSKVQRGL